MKIKTAEVWASMYGLTNMTLFDLDAAADDLGVPYIVVDEALKTSLMTPICQRVFIDTRVVYIPNPKVCFRYLAKINRVPSPHLILVAGGPSELTSHRIPTFPFRSLTATRLSDLLETPFPQQVELCADKVDVVRDLVTRVKDQTLYQSVHALFYRIKDKEQRVVAQVEVFKYLSGIGRSVPTNLPGAMTTVLQSQRAKDLRAVMTFARANGLQNTLTQYPQADEFEVSYLLNKLAKIKGTRACK